MRALFGSFILAVCLLVGALTAHADPFAPLSNRGFTLLVLYDKDSESSVKELEKAFSEQTPFAQMHGWFHFKKHKMKDAYFAPCADVGTTRLVVCKDAKLLNDYGKVLGGDRVIALTGRGDGGSGGEMAVMSTKGVNYKDKFIPGAIHEFLHQLGFADEYNYEGTFKDQMCQGNGFKVNENVVYQDLSSMFFESEESARILLRDKIPWIRYISSSVSILTDGHVGTPENKYPPGTLGLFRGGGCNLQTPGWVAYEKSIMRTLRGPRNELFPPYVAQQIRLALQKAVFAHELEAATKLDASRIGTEAKKSVTASPVVEIKKN